jgi:hypothetical protein
MGYFKDGPLAESQIGLNKEFYSGSQASIFIGDIWLDDLCEYRYQTNYSAAPIYGYGSQLYDHVAEGKLIVQGSLTINFREPNYLWAILERNKYNQGNDPRDNNPLKDKNIGNGQLGQTDASFIADKRVNLDYFFNSKPGQMNNITKALQDERDFTKVNADRDEIDFNNGTFDIIIGYGAELNENSPGERIVGVKLTGKSKLIYHDGNPIKEQYNFFARNVI